jgi:hypothetical protein
MDRLILIEKLESLRRCVRRVEMRRAETVEALQGDPDRQDILALNLTRAVQLCVDIAGVLIADSDEPAPQTMGQAFDGADGIDRWRTRPEDEVCRGLSEHRGARLSGGGLAHRVRHHPSRFG